MEHVYPRSRGRRAHAKNACVGFGLKLERTHDFSPSFTPNGRDGRILITAVPLLYGTYTVTQGTGTFTLEPPLTSTSRWAGPCIRSRCAGRRRSATPPIGRANLSPRKRPPRRRPHLQPRLAPLLRPQRLRRPVPQRPTNWFLSRQPSKWKGKRRPRQRWRRLLHRRWKVPRRKHPPQ